jgi:hypothetical protein
MVACGLAPAADARGLDLRLNEVQVLGSHNSYHIQPHPDLIALYLVFDPLAYTLEYTHRPLTEQFDLLGVRQIELDVYADPDGGLFAEPLSLEVLEGEVVHLPELEPPGMKVLHIADIDVGSTCPTLVACLTEVKAWSDAHPRHLPIMILIEAKDDPPPDIPLDFVVPIPFRGAELADLDAEIRSVFPEEQLITPDDIRGGRPTLESAVLEDGWPTLRAARGKVLFALDNGGAVRDAYIAGHPSLGGRVLFADASPGEPEAAFVKLNDVLADGALIKKYVRAGYIVRTRADADTEEARSGDTTRRDAALASGAQFVSTDYPEPGPFGTDYVVAIPGGAPARCNPLNAPRRCPSAALENSTGRRPLAGTRLFVRDQDGRPARRKLVVSATDALVETPLPGNADDPTTAGATLTLLNAATGETAAFFLPAGAEWQGLGTPAGQSGYIYRDPSGANGPCKKLSVKQGLGFRALCDGANGDIPFTLDEPQQGALAVTLRLGAGDLHCLSFGGTVVKDTPATGGRVGSFSARKAAAGECP